MHDLELEPRRRDRRGRGRPRVHRRLARAHLAGRVDEVGEHRAVRERGERLRGRRGRRLRRVPDAHRPRGAVEHDEVLWEGRRALCG